MAIHAIHFFNGGGMMVARLTNAVLSIPDFRTRRLIHKTLRGVISRPYELEDPAIRATGIAHNDAVFEPGPVTITEPTHLWAEDGVISIQQGIVCFVVDPKGVRIIS